MINSQLIIKQLNLQKHPEGGWYKELYRSNEIINKEALPNRFNGDRCFSTSIYFLLESHENSVFHKIKSDEIWHFYNGSPITIHIIDETGKYFFIVLGKDLNYQCTVPANCWFAAEVSDKNNYALVGCTVSPGFDFKDFEIGKKEELIKSFQQHETIIRKLSI